MSTTLDHPAGQALTLKEKLLIGVLVGVCIGIVSALVQHHATNLVQANRRP
jgi:hypothetical protein